MPVLLEIHPTYPCEKAENEDAHVTCSLENWFETLEIEKGMIQNRKNTFWILAKSTSLSSGSNLLDPSAIFGSLYHVLAMFSKQHLGYTPRIGGLVV